MRTGARACRPHALSTFFCLGVRHVLVHRAAHGGLPSRTFAGCPSSGLLASHPALSVMCLLFAPRFLPVPRRLGRPGVFCPEGWLGAVAHLWRRPQRPAPPPSGARAPALFLSRPHLGHRHRHWSAFHLYSVHGVQGSESTHFRSARPVECTWSAWVWRTANSWFVSTRYTLAALAASVGWLRAQSKSNGCMQKSNTNKHHCIRMPQNAA